MWPHRAAAARAALPAVSLQLAAAQVQRGLPVLPLADWRQPERPDSQQEEVRAEMLVAVREIARTK